MKKGWTITQKSFDLLLNWLDEDVNKAGHKYQQIRERLIRMFISRGFSDAEDLADETFNRVISKIEKIAPEYSGDRSYYFYNVASKITLEAKRRKESELNEAKIKQVSENQNDQRMDCLEKCLRKLPTEQFRLIMSYYGVEKDSKVSQRQGLADAFSLNINALRVKMNRIRATLRDCIEECVARA